MGGFCTAPRFEDSHNVTSPQSISPRIFSKIRTKVQYAAHEPIISVLVQATKNHLLIDDEESKTAIQLNWKKLQYVDVPSDKKRHYYFQFAFEDELCPKIKVYCNSKEQKYSWIQFFKTFRPIASVIISKTDDIIRECASRLKYNQTDIECALMMYSQYHEEDTKYDMKKLIEITKDLDMDVHKLVYGYINETERDLLDSSEYNIFNVPKAIKDLCYKYRMVVQNKIDNDIHCGVKSCKKKMKRPVKDIYGKVFCLEHVKEWEKNPNLQCKDPVTNAPLPQDCRLLTPHFSKLVTIFNQQYQNQQIPERARNKLQMIDQRIDLRRQKIVRFLRKTECHEKIAEEMINTMFKSKKLGFDEYNLDDIMIETCEYIDCHKDIERLVSEGMYIYNNNIKRITGDKSDEYIWKWTQPQWKERFKPDKQRWSQVYQVEEKTCTAIRNHTTDIMNQICTLIQQSTEEKEQSLMKEKMVKIILQKQKEILSTQNSQNSQDAYNEKQFNAPNKSSNKSNQKYINVKRIIYEESHGYVNTRCVREISECIEKKQSFNLYHSDLVRPKMTREQLVRFLDTAGVNGMIFQHYLYQSFAADLKLKLSNVSRKIKNVIEQKYNDDDEGFKQTKGYFPYFKYLKSVNVKQINDVEANELELKDENDKVAVQLIFDCDYDEHLNIYNMNKEKFAQVIRFQFLKHLKLGDETNHRISVRNVKKGSIEATLQIDEPFITLVKRVPNSFYNFCCFIKRYISDLNFKHPMWMSMFQGSMVGGGIGAIAGATIASAVTLGPVGVVIGCAIAVGCILGAIGFGIAKYIKSKKNETTVQINHVNVVDAPIQDDIKNNIAIEVPENEEIDDDEFDEFDEFDVVDAPIQDDIKNNIAIEVPENEEIDDDEFDEFDEFDVVDAPIQDDIKNNIALEVPENEEIDDDEFDEFDEFDVVDAPIQDDIKNNIALEVPENEEID
eukprot:292187_1